MLCNYYRKLLIHCWLAVHLSQFHCPVVTSCGFSSKKKKKEKVCKPFVKWSRLIIGGSKATFCLSFSMVAFSLFSSFLTSADRSERFHSQQKLTRSSLIFVFAEERTGRFVIMPSVFLYSLSALGQLSASEQASCLLLHAPASLFRVQDWNAFRLYSACYCCHVLHT